MNSVNSSFKVGIEFPSVLRAISKQIYETPHAFLRENVQNAIDAVRIQAKRDKLDPNSDDYCINVDIDDKTVVVRDNGIGMSREELQSYFWTIGSSGKRNKEAQDAGCVGMFGIGGFANFGVCEELEVVSQDATSLKGTLTRLSAETIQTAGAAIPSVTLKDSDAAAPRGTVVEGRLFKLPNVDDLKEYLRGFIRFVPIKILFNDEKISQQRFSDVEDRENLTQIGESVNEWDAGDIKLIGSLWEDRGHTLVAAIDGMMYRGDTIALTGMLRFENGPVDAFKRGFKLCATQIPSTIGVTGRIDCDLFKPTAGRDSLDSSTSALVGHIGALLENVVVDEVMNSSERIAQHTRVFRLIVRRGLIKKMGNVSVRLADGSESLLADIKRRSSEGVIGVYYGTSQKHALNQVMTARGHIVVQLASDRYRRDAERRYLEKYCNAKPFDGMIDCAEVYEDHSLFERVFLSEVEQNISKAFEIKDFKITAGKLTEDLPTFVKERSGSKHLEVFVDVRHSEVKKLETLGLNQLFYSLVAVFCSEYIGPSLKKWSPRFFGDGSLNLELFSNRRSELWVLVKDDIGIVRKGGQRLVVTRNDVTTINVSDQQSQETAKNKKHRILSILDDNQMTGLAGYFIRLPGWGYRAYGDLVADCDSQGVVWAGNKITFVASDGISAQFQYEIRLDEIVATHVNGMTRAEGALEINRPLQNMFDGLYFPIPGELERFLVPMNENSQIRLDLHCEWIDMRTSKVWEAV